MRKNLLFSLWVCQSERLYSEKGKQKAFWNLCYIIFFSQTMTDQNQPQWIHASAFYPGIFSVEFIRENLRKPVERHMQSLWKPHLIFRYIMNKHSIWASCSLPVPVSLALLAWWLVFVTVWVVTETNVFGVSAGLYGTYAGL